MTVGTIQPGLKRRLGFGLLTLYGVGVMVGAGIYVLVGAVAGQAGVWAPLTFLLAAVIAAPTGFSYAELTGRIPEAAGEAAYLRTATGLPLAAAAVGLAIEVVGVVSAAVVLQGGVGYLRSVVDLPEALLIVAIGGGLGVVALIGVVESLLFAAILTTTEIAGLFHPDHHRDRRAFNRDRGGRNRSRRGPARSCLGFQHGRDRGGRDSRLLRLSRLRGHGQHGRGDPRPGTHGSPRDLCRAGGDNGAVCAGLLGRGARRAG
jgi:hypothetical protein